MKMEKRKFLLSAGPTHEPIDAVRYIANRSSGVMGIALAKAAHDAGHEVTLLIGPVESPLPKGICVERFETTADLQTLLQTHFPLCDLLIMAAAVADYRPVASDSSAQPGEPTKLQRTKDNLILQLQPTPDLVAECALHKQPHQKIIGFALEEPKLLEKRAKEKLARKKLDAIVANPLQTMGSVDIDATIYQPNAAPITPGPMTKANFAHWLIDEFISQYGLL